MNFVLFDQLFDTDIADTVGLDNDHAVSMLYGELEALGDGEDKPIVYIGYGGLGLPSETMRKEAYRRAAGERARTFAMPWRGNIEAAAGSLMDRLEREFPSGVRLLCNSGGIGLQMARLASGRGLGGQFRIGTIDYMPEMDLYPIIAVEQPMQPMAERIYQLLVAQSNRGTNWKAAAYRLQGRLVYCGEWREAGASGR